MSGHAHQSPAEIRAKLNHPIVDGDGHWVEYDPVFAEQMRKVGGDKAVLGQINATGCDTEILSPAQTVEKIQADYVKWGKVVKEASIKPE